MNWQLALAVVASGGLACGTDSPAPRGASAPVPPPAPALAEPGPVAVPMPASAPEPTPSSHREDPPSNNPAREEECQSKLAQLGLEHGNDACKPTPPAGAINDDVQDLPKQCVADSPRDRPCKTYGGEYKIRLEPDPAEPAACFGTKAIETTVRLKPETAYGDRRDLTWELGALLRALNLRDKAPTLGSDIRQGVCCIDIDVSEEVTGRYRRLVIGLASGETVVSAKASIGCDDSGDRAPLKVKVTRVSP